MTTVSVDLAYKSYRDLGIAVLARSNTQTSVVFETIVLGSQPEPNELAELLVGICVGHSANVLMIDGPQAWKDPENGFEHSRVCERQLNTPAKTGLPFTAKPKNYLPFIRFSIELFDALDALGWPRYSGLEPQGTPVVAESFPFSAWRALGIRSLPAKKKTTTAILAERAAYLAKQESVRMPRQPTHDELQAVVAGLAGAGLGSGQHQAIGISGIAPFPLESHFREGYIVNPVPASIGDAG